FMMYNLNMRIFIAIFIVFMAVFQIIALVSGWYIVLRWLDIPMHIAGGAWVAIAFWYFVCEKTDLISFRKKWIAVVVGMGVVALIGAVWEMYEFFSDVFVKQSHPLLSEPGWIYFDSLKDLFDDIFGAFIALVILVKYRWDRLKA
ncbi:MAG: hypothetical protein Q8P49_04470, partial [Candidatus Liptonbacteria bacterium]|nr:hypothetical protein [Candidatus Liptonbacteria bacterium]